MTKPIKKLIVHFWSVIDIVKIVLEVKDFESLSKTDPNIRYAPEVQSAWRGQRGEAVGHD